MSTPLDKVAEEVYYTQELLTQIFAAPIVALMQESAQQYILTGKFKNLVPAIQTSMQALWDRSLYAGIADAEYEIDNPTINLSSNLSTTIEFAKDPQLARIDGELKELNKYLQEAQSAFSAKDVNEIKRLIDLKTAERDVAKNPKNPTTARKIAEKIRLERELDTAKSSGNFDRVAQIRAQLYGDNSFSTPVSSPKPSQVSIAKPRQGKKILVTKDQIAREVNRGRADIKDSPISNKVSLGQLLSFDPQADLTTDPYAQLFENKTAKTKAEARLLSMNNLQVYATLNERYPSIARNSIFAQDYLQYSSTKSRLNLKLLNMLHKIKLSHPQKNPQL
jgi:hypothetical protein